MISVSIDCAPQDALEALERIAHSGDPVRTAGMAVYDFLRAYHRDFNWHGPRYLASAPGEEPFRLRVVEGWKPPVRTGDAVRIVNTFPLLSIKVHGGTITPKTARYLTIPCIAEAVGMPAREFPDPLFVAGNALCRRVGRKVEAVYALKTWVDAEPVAGAMPPASSLESLFARTLDQELTRAFEGWA